MRRDERDERDRRDEREASGPTLRHNPFAALKKDGVPHSSLVNEPVSSPPDTAPAPTPKGGAVVVRREKKGRGGKAVTVVEGAGLAGHDLGDLARVCAKSFGTGARVESGAVVVQGELVERVIALLVARGITRVIRGS